LGLIELQPEKGWALTKDLLRDTKNRYANKLAAMGTLRFCHACKPKTSDPAILDCLVAVVETGDMPTWRSRISPLAMVGADQAGALAVQKPSHAGTAGAAGDHSLPRFCCPDPEAVASSRSAGRRTRRSWPASRRRSNSRNPVPAKKNP